MTSSSKSPESSISILGVPISAINLERASDRISHLIEERAGGRYVCACDVHSLMRAREDAGHMAALKGAAMVTPDGQPLVWTGKLRGQSQMGRVAGPDLLPKLCARGIKKGWRHYFYGGAEGVAEDLADALLRRFPGLIIAGLETPPFRPPTHAEIRTSLARIARSKADIVWVGIGCPKQERWMAENARHMRAVPIGVGAAFDFHAGRIARAPRWMQSTGLEWLNRLASEPGRLWRRYLWLAPRFAIAAGAETLKLALGQIERDKDLKRGGLDAG